MKKPPMPKSPMRTTHQKMMNHINRSCCNSLHLFHSIHHYKSFCKKTHGQCIPFLIFILYQVNGRRNGTMDEFNTRSRISNHCIILSLAPTRNETCRSTRSPCFLKDEVNFTNKSRIRHGSNQLLACLKPLLPL